MEELNGVTQEEEHKQFHTQKFLDYLAVTSKDYWQAKQDNDYRGITRALGDLTQSWDTHRIGYQEVEQNYPRYLNDTFVGLQRAEETEDYETSKHLQDTIDGMMLVFPKATEHYHDSIRS